jgi:Protein of unknown function (DUF3096)
MSFQEAPVARPVANACVLTMFRETPAAFAAISGSFREAGNSRRRTASLPAEPVRYDPPAIRLNAQSLERKFMHITVAHISPILSLIAGVLILIMPRLLNLIVAIFLIINGAIGLGLLKWLHL